MKRTIVVVITSIATLVLVFVGLGTMAEKGHNHSVDSARKAQAVFNDPAAFRAGLVEMVRQAANYDGAQHEHHAKLGAPDGPWGRILAERDAILKEGLGENFKSHSQIDLLEVEVLYNLGKLDIIRNYESFQKVRGGDAYHKGK